jgi:hypothetical protein
MITYPFAGADFQSVPVQITNSSIFVTAQITINE